MNSALRRRLALIDAAGWPVALAIQVLDMGTQPSLIQGVVLATIAAWGARRVRWAREDGQCSDGREVWIAYNPFNPVSLILALLLRRQEVWNGPYRFTTWALIKAAAFLLVVFAVFKFSVTGMPGQV